MGSRWVSWVVGGWLIDDVFGHRVQDELMSATIA